MGSNFEMSFHEAVLRQGGRGSRSERTGQTEPETIGGGRGRTSRKRMSEMVRMREPKVMITGQHGRKIRRACLPIPSSPLNHVIFLRLDRAKARIAPTQTDLLWQSG